MTASERNRRYRERHPDRIREYYLRRTSGSKRYVRYATVEEKFLALTNKGNQFECWEFVGPKTSAGYGLFWWKGKLLYAHRFSYELHKGPANDLVMHKCNNPACVNPNHLETGTHEQNSRYMMQCGRGKRQFRKGMK